MGRGLAAILAVAPREVPEELRRIPVELIDPNPDQPRRRFDEDALAALAGSVRERGVVQPVLVRPLPGGRYQLVAGERRWRAAALAEQAEVPAIVRHHDDATSLEVALVENVARQDLNPVEEARACAALVEELSLTKGEVGRRIGRSRVAVSNLIRLLDLPDEALGLLESGRLSEGHGRALLMAPDHGDRRRLARAAAEGRWSVRTTEARARESAGGEIRVRRRTRPADPDREAALLAVAERLAAALGADVRIADRGEGCRAEIDFASVDEAMAAADRLADRGVA